MPKGRALVSALVAVGVLVGTVRAAVPPPAPPRPESVFQRQEFFDRDTRARLERAAPAEQKALIEWGGVYIPSYTFFNDLANDHAGVTIQDLRLWTQIQIDSVHRIYARGALRYTDWSAGDSQGFRAHDLEGMNLEVGYYELDVSGAAAKYAGQAWPVNLLVRGGRQYVEVGRGIALSDYLDVGLFELETRDFTMMGFAGRSIESQDNIDRSAPHFTRSRRTWYGLEIKCARIPNHEPYVFWVMQRDWSEEKPEDPTQGYRYDSQYFGVGSRGSLSTRTRYEVEALWEHGTSHAFGQNIETEPVRGFAFDTQVDHFFDAPAQPVVSVEYAYASGDSDRQSATTAILGNRVGTDDKAFQGFGYVNSGLALGARFTNLQFVRLGGRFTPYDRKTECGRIDLGANFYFLWKAKEAGPISDPTAINNSADLGHELDLFAEWRIFSDLAWSIHYGRFWPGDAYGERQPRDFFFSALTFSF